MPLANPRLYQKESTMTQRSSLTIMNLTKGTTLCQQAKVTSTMLEGLRGLLGRDRLDHGTGLLLRPSSGIHTFGMRFSIDVVALDRNMRVLGTWSNVKPRRICAVSFRTWSVLELPVGQIEAACTEAGDCLSALDNHSPGLGS